MGKEYLLIGGAYSGEFWSFETDSDSVVLPEKPLKDSISAFNSFSVELNYNLDDRIYIKEIIRNLQGKFGRYDYEFYRHKNTPIYRAVAELKNIRGLTDDIIITSTKTAKLKPGEKVGFGSLNPDNGEKITLEV